MYNGYDNGNNNLSNFTNYTGNNFNNRNDKGGTSGFTVFIAFIGLIALVGLVLFAPDFLEGKKKYTVTFMDLEGVYLINDSVEVNSYILEPAPPTKEGYQFLGWYLDNDAYTFGTPVTSDLYLRARWLNVNTNEIEEVKVPDPTPVPKSNSGNKSNANNNSGSNKSNTSNTPNKTNSSTNSNSGSNQNTNTNTNNGGNKTTPNPTPTPSSKTNPGKTPNPTPTITSEPTPSPTPTPTPIGEPKPEEPPKEPTPTPVPTPEPKLLRVQILSDNPIIKTNPTLTSSTSSNGEKGLYRMTVSNSFGGGTGFTYFFRGDVTNNVVEFAGFTWRIVRINENGTVRLILDSLINNNAGYVFNAWWEGYTYLYYTNSGNYMKKNLNNWYNSNITGDNASKVASNNYFCEAARVKYDTNYSAGDAELVVYNNYTPTLSCNADGNGKRYVNSYVGLLTYDEAVLAGAYRNVANNSYYLNKTANNSNITKGWWLMSPAGVASHNNASVEWVVNSSGGLYMDLVCYDYFGIRPVINLKSSVTVIKNSAGHYVVQ